ncbi:MAG: hypothetical protein DRI36_04945, partial [Caldiserica bacterium]
MNSEYFVSIYNKEGVKEKFSFDGFEIFKKGKVYFFSGSIEKNLLENITKEILIDPVIEDFSIGIKKEKNLFIVTLKKLVLDVEAETLKSLLRFLKIKNIKDVRTGKLFKVNKKIKNKIK